MIVKNIDQKIKLTLFVSIMSFVCAAVISVFSLGYSFSLVKESKKNIYVLDNDVPILVQQTGQDVNRKVEIKSHVNLFHMLFFTLPPDDEFMKNNISKSMYLIDKTGATEYNNLKEKGYYNSILSSSAVISIKADSISIDMAEKKFTYFGTQRIERDTRILIRELITTGNFHDVPRTDNNPHGFLITNWKTVLNKDIKDEFKAEF